MCGGARMNGAAVRIFYINGAALTGESSNRITQNLKREGMKK